MKNKNALFKKFLIFNFCLILLTGCGDIKFFEKVSSTATETTLETGSLDDQDESVINQNDDWKTATLPEETSNDYNLDDLSEPSYSSNNETTNSISEDLVSPPETSDTNIEITMPITEETTLTVSLNNEFTENGYTFEYLNTPQTVYISKVCKLEKNIGVESDMIVIVNTELEQIATSVDNNYEYSYVLYKDKYYFIKNDYLSFNPIIEEQETVSETETIQTTASSLIETVPTTTTPITIITTTTQKPTETTPPTTTPTTIITTLPPTVQTTTQPTTTTPITTQPPPPTTQQTTSIKVGGIPFPSDTSKTNIVFGQTFYVMEIQASVINSCTALSGPNNDSSFGYRKLATLNVGDVITVTGISQYGDWVRIKTSEGKTAYCEAINLTPN